MFGKFGAAFGDHRRQRAPGVVLKMPLFGDDMAEEPREPIRVGDQLFIQRPDSPFDQHPANVENDSLNGWGRRGSHAAKLFALRW